MLTGDSELSWLSAAAASVGGLDCSSAMSEPSSSSSASENLSVLCPACTGQ